MNAAELTLSITALANSLASSMSDEELDIAIAAFSQLSDTLATISLVRAKKSGRDTTIFL